MRNPLEFLGRRWSQLPRDAVPAPGQAAAYFIDSCIVVCARSLTTTGLHIDDGPRLRATIEDPAALGGAVLQALSATRAGVAHPSDFKALMQPTLEAARVSHRRFNAEARLVAIEADERRVTFTATENLGAKGGFQELAAHAVVVAGSDKEALGRGLLQAFERAT